MNKKTAFALIAATIMIFSPFVILSHYISTSDSASASPASGTISYTLENQIPVGTGPNAAVSFDGYIYIANLKSNNITVINGDQTVGSISQEVSEPNGLDIATYGSETILLVSNYNMEDVSAYDISANPSSPSYLGEVTVGNGPGGLSYDSNNGYVYVADGSSANVSYFPLDDFTGADQQIPSSNIPVQQGPQWATYDPSDGYVYEISTDQSGTSVYIISASTNSVISSISNLPEMPLVYDPYYSSVIGVSNQSIYSFTGTTDTSTSVDIGGTTWAATVGPDGNIYVANQKLNLVDVVTSNSLVDTISLASGSSPQGIIYSNSAETIYVSDFDSNDVTPVKVTQNSYYSVTFTESGLNSGTQWQVTFNNVQETSQGTSITFSQILGGQDYAYSIPSVSGYSVSPSQGSLELNGNVGVSITFTPLYNVMFQESGLPSGDTWYVAMDGQNLSSSTSTINFASVPEGTYYYSIFTPFDYHASPASGYLSINGPETYDVEFTANLYPVSFMESGLPAGDQWNVTFNGVKETNVTTTGGGTITFNVADGTSYQYIVASPPGYAADPSSGYISVDGNPVSTQIEFSDSFTFTLGLNATSVYLSQGQQAHVSAYVNISFPDNTPVYLSNSTLPAGLTVLFTPDAQSTTYVSSITLQASGDAPTGTYDITITATGGDLARAIQLTVTILEHSSTTGKIAFQESGLSTGAIWFVDLNGSLQTSDSGSIDFTEPTGTYAFNVSAYGYLSDPESGTLILGSSGLQEQITFSKINAHYGLLSDNFSSDLAFNVSKWNITGTQYNFYLPDFVTYVNAGLFQIDPGTGLEMSEYSGGTGAPSVTTSSIYSRSEFTLPLQASASFIFLKSDAAIAIYMSIAGKGGMAMNLSVSGNGQVDVYDGTFFAYPGITLSPNLEYTITEQITATYIVYDISLANGSSVYSAAYNVNPAFRDGEVRLLFGNVFEADQGVSSGMSSILEDTEISSYRSYNLNATVIQSESGYNPSQWSWEPFSVVAFDTATGLNYSGNSSGSFVNLTQLPSGTYEVFVSTGLMDGKANITIQQNEDILLGNPLEINSSTVFMTFTFAAPAIQPLSVNLTNLGPLDLVPYDTLAFTADASGWTGNYAYKWSVFDGRGSNVPNDVFTGGSTENFNFTQEGLWGIEATVTSQGDWLGLSENPSSVSSSIIWVDVKPPSYFLTLLPTGSNANVTLSLQGHPDWVLAYTTSNGMGISGTLKDASALQYEIPSIISSWLGIANGWQGITTESGGSSYDSNYIVQPHGSVDISNLTVPVASLKNGTSFNITLDPMTTYAALADGVTAALGALSVLGPIMHLSGVKISLLQTVVAELVMDLVKLLSTDLVKFLTNGISGFLSAAGMLISTAASLVKDMVTHIADELLNPDSADSIVENLATSVGENVASRIAELSSIILSFIPLGTFAAGLYQIISTLFQGNFATTFTIDNIQSSDGIVVSSGDGNAPYVVVKANNNQYYGGVTTFSGTTGMDHSPYTPQGYSMFIPDPQTLQIELIEPNDTHVDNYTLSLNINDKSYTVTGNFSDSRTVNYTVSQVNGTVIITQVPNEKSISPVSIFVLLLLISILAVAVVVIMRRTK